jgi:hypothetical protein
VTFDLNGWWRTLSAKVYFVLLTWVRTLSRFLRKGWPVDAAYAAVHIFDTTVGQSLIVTEPASPLKYQRKLLHPHCSGASTSPRFTEAHRLPISEAELDCALASVPRAPVRETLLEYLHHGGGCPLSRFADQQMEVLGHHYLTDRYKPIAMANLFEDAQELVLPARGA